VGVKDSEVVSFISAYIHPKKPDTLFVWQVAVGSRARGKGVGKIMLEKLVQREVCKEVVYLETTVTPSNNPSRSLFYSFSRAVDAKVEEEVFFPKEVFGEEGHEEEILIKIGPFNTLKS
jgi:L-2,4-diaminobutyric acid acetyltransferase